MLVLFTLVSTAPSCGDDEPLNACYASSLLFSFADKLQNVTLDVPGLFSGTSKRIS